MAIIIDEIALPNTLVFEDEFTRSSMRLQKDISLTGALIAEPSVLVSGRPITLRGGVNHAWVLRSLMVALRASANTPGEKGLHVHGTEYTVLWDHDRGAISVTQFKPYGVFHDAMKYRNLILRLVET